MREALLAALGRHGIPDQILTDNGKVFTGRFGPAEVLFDRICAENGIRHLLTAPVRQPLPACPHDLATKPRASVSTARSVQSYINEFREGASATHQAATLIDFASKPLIVITAAEDMTEVAGCAGQASGAFHQQSATCRRRRDTRFSRPR